MCPGQPSFPASGWPLRLRRKIESGEWPGGEQIPSVTELAATHGVSRATVVKAVRVLVDEGLVVTRQGWGTFVV